MKNSACLPCPCCGGYATIEHGKQYRMLLQDWHTDEEARYQPCLVRCRECGCTATSAACNADFGGAEGAAREAERKVVEIWNRRNDMSSEFKRFEPVRSGMTTDVDI